MGGIPRLNYYPIDRAEGTAEIDYLKNVGVNLIVRVISKDQMLITLL